MFIERSSLNLIIYEIDDSMIDANKTLKSLTTQKLANEDCIDLMDVILVRK